MAKQDDRSLGHDLKPTPTQTPRAFDDTLVSAVVSAFVCLSLTLVVLTFR